MGKRWGMRWAVLGLSTVGALAHKSALIAVRQRVLADPTLGTIK
jgi:hypothetical protein